MPELIPESISVLNRWGVLVRYWGTEEESFQNIISNMCKGVKGCVRVPSFLRMLRAEFREWSVPRTRGRQSQRVCLADFFLKVMENPGNSLNQRNRQRNIFFKKLDNDGERNWTRGIKAAGRRLLQRLLRGSRPYSKEFGQWKWDEDM